MDSAIDTFLDAIIVNILEPIVALLGVLAFLYFVFGVVMFIRNADNEEKRPEGQRHMLWAIIGLVIIFGANAIIGFILATLGVADPR